MITSIQIEMKMELWLARATAQSPAIGQTEAQFSRRFMRHLTWQASDAGEDGQEQLTSNNKI